jgi:succinate dehydrogenase / fumarate reductase cytochrome b subunit
MNGLAHTLGSSIGRKLLVAVTGLGLLGFVVAHMLGNLQIFQGPEALNAYAANLKSLGPVLWALRGGLLLMFVVHIGLTLKLAAENRAARPERYAHPGRVQSTPGARSMVLTGLMVLAFVLYHLAHFTLGWTHPEHAALTESVAALGGSEMRHDVFSMVVLGFQQPLVSGLYLVAVALLALHLSHGVQSVFQSLGLCHPGSESMLRKLGCGVAAVIFFGNASIPVAILAGLVQLPAGA